MYVTLPASVLRQLYVQGSLMNTSGGVVFKLKNSPAPATVIELEIAVDENKIPPENIYIVFGSQKKNAGELASVGQKFNA